MSVDLKDLIKSAKLDLDLGVADPRTSGYTAGIGAIGRDTNNELWRKSGDADTDWELLVSTKNGKFNDIDIVADKTARKALTNTTVGLTRVIQSDKPNIIWELTDTDPSVDASWKGIPSTDDPNGDIIVSMELADVSGTVPDTDVLGVAGGRVSKGDGVTTGGKRIAYLDDIPKSSQGYIRTTSLATSDISVSLKHDGGDGAAGICYSVNGGAPVYSVVAADTFLHISIPHNGGAPIDITIWPATSATSGKVGNITRLYCHSNQLTTLDVSGLTALTTLECNDNQLTTLDVGGLTALTTLDCSNNQLTTLDVSGLTALTSLACNYNPLTELNVEGCSAVTSLSISGCNQLLSVDLSPLTSLTVLYVEGCAMPSLDLSVVPTLVRLAGRNASINSLNLSGLTSMELCWMADGSLTEVIAVGWDGARLVTSYGGNYVDLEGNQLTTDAVYEMLDGAITADPATLIQLDGNPCEVGDVLQDGDTYTATQLEALAASKDYGLQLN